MANDFRASGRIRVDLVETNMTDYCGTCGKRAGIGDSFCDECGSPLLPNAPPTSAPGVAPSGVSYSEVEAADGDSAPRGFWEAAAHVMFGQYEEGADALAGIDSDDVWGHTARALRAFALIGLERHAEAVLVARTADPALVLKEYRFTWYNALAMAYNMNDDLELSRRTCDEGIGAIRSSGSLAGLDALLVLRANVLKQLAAVASSDPGRLDNARAFAVQAVRDISEACELDEDRLEDSDGEIAALARIATRAGAVPSDFSFLDAIPGGKAWRGQYFDAESMNGQATVQAYNTGNDAAGARDFHRAAFWYARALERAREDTANRRCFKAMILYNYGIALIEHQGMNEDTLPHWTDSRRAVVAQLRSLWEKALVLLAEVKNPDPVDAQTTEELRSRIMSHRLMRGVLRATFGIGLAKEGRKVEARDLLKKALKDLSPQVPEDWKLLRIVHIRLAALCNDTGQKSESAEHARWVLRNCDDLDQMTRMMMQVCAGEI